MAEGQRNRVEAPSRWVQVVVALISLVVGIYGLSCLIRGKLVTEGVVLEGVGARIVGAIIAVIAAISLVRILIPRGRR